MSWFPVFDSRYEVVLADTDIARRIHFRLRYRVYCLEEGLEEPSQYPNGEETDRFDWNAVHLLVRFKPTGQWIAAVRLVLPGPDGLPVAAHARLDTDFAQVLLDRRSRVAEVSRLCIIDDFRVRPAKNVSVADRKSVTRDDGEGALWQYRQREILLGLFRAMWALCVQRRIDQLVFLISPALGRVLSRLNVSFEVIGEPCRHRGLRYPCSTRIADALPALTHTDSNRGRRGGRQLKAYRRFSEVETPPLMDLPLANNMDACRA